jgi:hypothetical protein
MAPDSMAPNSGDNRDRGDALDLLEREDHELGRLLDEFRGTRGPGVEDRARHGNAGKRLIRALAVREAAREEVAQALRDPAPGPDEEAERLLAHLEQQTDRRRSLLAQVDDLAAGVAPMTLNQGQDFDGAMAPLADLVAGEVRWELVEGLPELRRLLGPEPRPLPSARFVRRHAPSHRTPGNHRWFERLAFFKRLHTLYDRARDYPGARGGSDQP